MIETPACLLARLVCSFHSHLSTALGWIDIVRQEWYGRWLSGVFLDETSHAADDLDRGDRAMCAKYKEYRQHVQRQMGEGATVRRGRG